MRTELGAGILTIAAFFGSGVWIAGAWPHPAQAAEAPKMEVRALSPKSTAREQRDREVDRVALSAQESAIAKLSGLLKRFRGGRQEEILLAKLADLQQQRAAIIFRLSMGKSRDAAQYNLAMKQSISTLDRLIARYPDYPKLAHSYFLRGKAYEEIGNKELATRDYLYLVSHYPTTEETSPAYMSLADFAIDANHHSQAIAYLKKLEERPEDPHYPFALYKLAWSYYNIKDIGHALEYAKRQVDFYNDKAKRNPEADAADPNNVLTSDSALRENTLLDIPLFYFEGVEEKQADYTASDALGYFHKVEPGPVLGRMALRFAKLLRSRDRDNDLLGFKRRFLASYSDRPESLDIVTLTFEHQVNQRQYAQLVDTAKDIVALYAANQEAKNPKDRWEGFSKAQKLVLDTAEKLQALIIKNKESDQARSLSLTLAALYESFTRIVKEADPRIPQVHYNLAETLFTIKDYAGATENYRWVVEHRKGINKTVAKSVADAAVKAIAARYEILRDRKIIPAEIKAVAAPRDLEHFSSPRLDPILAGWVDWIDENLKECGTEECRRQMDNFVFESDRTLYSQGDLARALERLEDFAKRRSASPYAIPSASLLLDSAIAASNWDRTFELATGFMKIWKDGAFAKRLFEVASDSLYKKIDDKYQAKRYADVLKDSDSFLDRYQASARVPDCLSLAAEAALANQENDRAMGYLSKLIKSGKAGGHIAEALMSRARLEEDQYAFLAAAADYHAFLGLSKDQVPKSVKLSDKEMNSLRRKVLALTWVSGSAPALLSLIPDKTICTEDLEEECDKYAALAALTSSGSGLDENATSRALDRLRKASGEAKTIWAVHALQGAKHLAVRDRDFVLRAVGSGYKDLDPVAKYELLPLISDLIPGTFRMNRLAMKDVAPLRADERYITHRVDMIRGMENAAAKILGLPWARVRAEVMNEISYLYLDLARGLQDLPPPKGLSEKDLQTYQDTIRKLVVPFEEKGQDIRSKAWDIASRFSIEDADFQAIMEPFFADNPSQAKKLRSQALPLIGSRELPGGLSYLPLGLAYAHELEGSMSSGSVPVYSAWLRALKARNWAQVAFFMQEAKEKKLFTDGELGLIRAISFAEAGARGEGMLELEDARNSLSPRLKKLATLTLAQNRARTYSFDKARPLYEEIVPLSALAESRKPAESKSE